ncbi:MAG: DUF1573 domain-containing protein [Candidatus Omnitrophica bacterium]|nr:DUF1573 domain-containing protein [Candidatus Omnitrophota bacterium]
MKIPLKLLLLIPFFFFTCFFCNASNDNQGIEHDFGTIPSTHTVTHDFILNQEITNVVTLCECVKAKVDKKTAQSYVVHVEFDPREYKGATAEEILLVNSSGERITLRIKAFVQ